MTNWRDVAEAQSEALGKISRQIIGPDQRDHVAEQITMRVAPSIGWTNEHVGAGGALGTSGLMYVNVGLSADELANIRAVLSYKGRDTARDTISLDSLLAAPKLLEIATSDAILATVADYFGAPALLSSIQAWWTFRGDQQGDQIYHRDLPSVRFCKLFIYLTDVTDNTGPHQFVVGSHKLDHIKQRLIAGKGTSKDLELMFARADMKVDDALINRFLKDDVVTITGPAGTAFMEDTYAIHRAAPPTSGERLIFVALYSVCLDVTAHFMQGLRARNDWLHRVPDTTLSRYAVSYWIP